MNRLNYEEKHRFSFRKTTVGLASVALFAFFLGSPLAPIVDNVIYAETEAIKEVASVSYHHALESELTSEERASIVRELPKYIQGEAVDYVLDYRPESQKAVAKILPKTGGLSQGYKLSGALLVLTVLGGVGLRRRKKIVPMLLIIGVGSFVLSASAIAFTDGVLAQYDKTFQIDKGESLPDPIKIDGHRYIGHITLTKTAKPSNEVINGLQ